MALVHDISPGHNPALGLLSLFPMLVALRAAAHACSSRTPASKVAAQFEAAKSVHMGWQQDAPSRSTGTLHNAPASCKRQVLAGGGGNALNSLLGAVAVDVGFGRMRGGAADGVAAAGRSTHAAIHDERNRGVQIYINGEFFHRSEAKVSVFDSGFLVGDGIWEGKQAANPVLYYLVWAHYFLLVVKQLWRDAPRSSWNVV